MAERLCVPLFRAAVELTTIFPTSVFRGKFYKVFPGVQIITEVASDIRWCLFTNLVAVNQFCIQTHFFFFFKKGRLKVALRKL